MCPYLILSFLMFLSTFFFWVFALLLLWPFHFFHSLSCICIYRLIVYFLLLCFLFFFAFLHRQSVFLISFCVLFSRWQSLTYGWRCVTEKRCICFVDGFDLKGTFQQWLFSFGTDASFNCGSLSGDLKHIFCVFLC